ncbi:hypothetical protein AMATHDRAFT_172853, partial [Amanita thiersii Skay4041]
MSIYSQSIHGQPSYGTPTYTQPSLHNGYSYPYFQPNAPVSAPPPVYHYLDPVSFRREFTTRLADLQVNSRPMIQTLSMLAQEYSRFAEIVAQCLEAHIRRVPPWMKLPAFYLLDAISKNVYEPYARQFASFVIPLFLDTYGQVDEVTRNKMEEMLLTWRTGSPTGKELFGVPPQIAIERGIWGDGATNYNVSSYSVSGQVTKAQVLSELEYTLGQKERALHANPYDNMSQNHINILHQLRKLVETGVSQEELQQILGQLRALVRHVSPPGNTQASSTWHTQYPTPSYPLPSVPSSSGQRLYHQPVNSYSGTHVIKPEQDCSIIGPAASTSSSAPNMPAPQENIANLLSTLLKAGVVSVTGTPTGARSPYKDGQKDIEQSEAVDLENESLRKYRKSILSQKIQLTSLDISRKRSKIIDFLYGQLNTQCKQCGIRFAETVDGKKKLEDHLDMHFRQNRKAIQNVGRGHSRSWFVGTEDWIHDLGKDVKGKGREDGRPYSTKTSAAEEIAKREAELKAQYVVVPPGDEAKPLSCPICKEVLKSEFLEEDEEWVWKNAVRRDERVYHATCYAEAAAVKTNYAARLRTEILGSRAGTPEVQPGSLSIPSRVTPPPSVTRMSRSKSPSLSPFSESKLAGTKRKIQNDDNISRGDGTPPLKKSALS